jgi:hypothetical protein
MTIEPPTTYIEPATTYIEPPTTYIEPGTTYIEPGTTYIEPGTTYIEPGTTYIEPGTTYIEPLTTTAGSPRTTIESPKIIGRLITIRDDIAFTINSTPTVIPASASQSQTSCIAPIVGGAVRGFFFFIGVIAITWFIRCIYVTRSWTKSHTYIFPRKKYRKSNTVSMEEKDIVLPYSVTRGEDQCKQLDLTNVSKSGFSGRSAQMTGGRPDSSTDLIGV